MTPVDLRPEPGAEAPLGRELDAVLLRQRYGEGRAGDEAALDEDRAQQPAALGLFGQSELQLVGCDETLLEEQLTQGPPDGLRRLHGLSIGWKPQFHERRMLRTR